MSTSNQKSRNNFDTLMKGSLKLGDNYYEATSKKRKTLAIPYGTKVFDTDLRKIFVGDGATYGGISENVRLKIRKVQVPAAATGATYTSGNGSGAGTFRWANASGLRTGDGITLASGAGTLPSGVVAGTYYLRKYDDRKTGGDETNGSLRFYLHSAPNAALSSTPATSGIISGATSGASGATFTMAIADVMAHDEDVLLMGKVASAVDVILPYPGAAAMSGYSIKVKAAGNNSAAVTVKQLSSGTIHENMIVNKQTNQTISLPNGTSGGFVDVAALPDELGWITIGQSNRSGGSFVFN